MKEKHTRTPIQIGNIGNIFITAEYENENVCLILDNRDEKVKSIAIFYGESHKLGINAILGNFELLSDSQRKVPLPEGFEKWKTLDFQVREENRSIPNTFLKKLSDEAKRLKDNPPQPKIEPSISKSEQTDNSRNIIGKDLKPDIETTNVAEQRSIDYQHKAETLVQETSERITELARTYKDGEAIDFVNIENPTPSQKVLLILN